MVKLTQTQLVNEYVAKKGESNNNYAGLLISNHWQCCDDIGDDGEWTEDLGPILEGLAPSIVISLKLTLLEAKEVRIQGHCILIKMRTFTLLLDVVKWLSRELRNFNIKRLSELDEMQVHTLYRNLTKRSATATNNSGRINKPINKRTVERRARLLERISINYQLGLTPDGIVTALAEAQYLELLKPTVTPYVEWKEWLKGGSLGEFPLECALTLLVHSISVIRSNSTRLILALQDAFKEHVIQKYPEHSFQQRSDKLSKKLKILNTYDYHENTVGDIRTRIAKDPFHRAVYNAYEARNGKVEEIDTAVIRTIGDYNKVRKDVAYSCLMIIMITSGIRASELRSLTRDSFKVDENGLVSFKSNIKKTNHSIGTERPITGVSLEAYNMLNDLNMKPNPNSSDSLFDIDSISNQLKVLTRCGGYQNWVINTLKTLLPDYKPEEHPAPSPHRFRHTWAELALRRFDGNVHEAVRSHFRHAVGSWMTMKYLKGKYHEDVELISKAYMSELIGRAASGKEELFGPVGRYILKQLAELKALTPEDIEELVEEFDIVEPHEYGYCMIRKDQRPQAKCFDKESQAPLYDQAKFELCGGCVGSLRLANHKDTIIRIGMAAQEHARLFEEMGYSAVTALSKKTVKLCESAIKDFDNRIPILFEVTDTEEA